MLPTLKTERLQLDEVVLDDASELDGFRTGDDQWALMAIEPQELSDSRARIEGYLQHKGPDDQRRLFDYVAREKATGKIIGCISLARSHPKIASIGFGVTATKTNKGFATEMAKAMVQFGFSGVGLHRLEADVAIQNDASIKVLEKLNMACEGTLRDCIFAQGKWWSEHKYAILARDL